MKLYTPFESAFATLYAEVVDRARAAGELLPGTPGTLSLRPRGDSGNYWYRRFYNLPGQAVEKIVCREDDQAAHDAMAGRIEEARWIEQQVSNLRKMGFQVVDKDAARVLVEMHNRRWFEAGLALVGTLAYSAWINDLGLKVTSYRTLDVDLARLSRLKVAASASFLEAAKATEINFFEIPSLNPKAPSTSIKRPGREGLRVDLLTHGEELGQSVPVPELKWHAQTIPHFDYLLQGVQPSVLLAGGHCIPVQVPQLHRLAWHKVYSSTQRLADRAKSGKDIQQAAVLIAAMVERESVDLASTLAQAPEDVRRACLQRAAALDQMLAPHPQAQEAFGIAVSGLRAHEAPEALQEEAKVVHPRHR